MMERSSPDQTECPECGQEFDSYDGMATHHGHMHGGRPKRECEQCGEWFVPADSRTRLCSQECVAESQRKEKVELICEECGGPFEVHECRKESARFCSAECLGRYKGKKNAKEKYTLICGECGDEYEVSPYRKEKSKYCSDRCRARSLVDRENGEECPTCGEIYGDLGKHLYRNPSHREGGVKCPVCGSGFKNRHGMKIHHEAAHGGLKEGKEVNCNNCGKEIRRYPSVIESGRNFYCSRDCMAERLSNLTGKQSPAYGAERVTKECPNCGSEVTRRKSEIGRGFCDQNCWYEYFPKEMSGENHPQWEGGKESYYGPNWHSRRREVMERDDYECKVCGMPRSEHKSEFGESLHVHHIQKLRTFRKDGDVDYEAANEISNLVTLCLSCHQEWEGIPLRPDAA